MHLKKILNDYFKSVLAFIKQIFLKLFWQFSLFIFFYIDGYGIVKWFFPAVNI